MRWWAADLSKKNSVQFAEFLSVNQFVGADYVPLFMEIASGQVHARHRDSFSDEQTAGLLQQGSTAKETTTRDLFVTWGSATASTKTQNARVWCT